MRYFLDILTNFFSGVKHTEYRHQIIQKIPNLYDLLDGTAP